jgi:hypothetical protein
VALLGYLLRAFVALFTVILLTVIVFPIFAVWTFLFILRHEQGPRALKRIAANALWQPDVVRFTRDGSSRS